MTIKVIFEIIEAAKGKRIDIKRNSAYGGMLAGFDKARVELILKTKRSYPGKRASVDWKTWPVTACITSGRVSVPSVKRWTATNLIEIMVSQAAYL